ncbi:hypothetical protein BHE74_00050323 [Ensete ventricosum]|nr:hypothetical protein BHE74_00050323 [Ensete ventricosum]
MPPANEAERWKWENAAAGAVAGFATVAALHPLDVVRTRFQDVSLVFIFFFLLPCFVSLFLVAARLISPGSGRWRSRSIVTNLFRAVMGRKQPCIVRYRATSIVPPYSGRSANQSTGGRVCTGWYDAK